MLTRAARRLELAALSTLLGILLTSFLLNIIPFAGPSNLFIASNASIMFDVDPFTVGFLVALGSASAKFIHYLVTFFAGKFIGGERRKRLDAEGIKLRKWASLALFVVAVTPLPDEPVIIPLGLLKYNPAKIFLVYFSGKFIIGMLGGYLGGYAQDIMSPMISQEVLIGISMALTIAVTVVLLKFDVAEIMEKILRRRKSVQTTSESLG